MMFFYYRRQHKHKKGPVHILQDLVEQDERDRPPYVTLIEQLFSFIGSDPENSVSFIMSTNDCGIFVMTSMV
jgi:hypothetical protein